MSATYWTEVAQGIAGARDFEQNLATVGLTVVRRGPATRNTVFLEVSDPGADPELEGKTVWLFLERDFESSRTSIRERVVIA